MSKTIFKKIKIGLMMMFAIVSILNIGLITEKTYVHIVSVYNKVENIFGQSAIAQSEPLPIIPGENVNFYGMDTTAGSGRHLGTPDTNICSVNVLTNSGAGSYNSGRGLYEGDFKYCIEEVDSPKVVVFEVSGNIEGGAKLGGFTGNEAETKGSYVTIAGQTAPSPGITIKKGNFRIERNCHDILVQHIRVRFGDDGLTGDEPISYQESWDSAIMDIHYRTEKDCTGPSTPSGCCLGAWPEVLSPGCNWRPPYNVVMDHCSFTWAIDETIESGADNTTYINNIMSEALNSKLHYKGPHSKGFLGKSDYGDTAGNQNVIFANNLLSHNLDRNPRFAGGAGIIANNFIYDYKFGTIVADTGDSGRILLSIVGNYLKETVNTEQWSMYMVAGTYEDSRIYLAPDNYWNGQIQTDPWNDNSGYLRSCDYWTPCDNPVPEANRAYSPPLWPEGYVATSATDARTYVLANAGSRPADRDLVDARIVNQAENELCAEGCIITNIRYSNADCIGSVNPHPCCTGAGTGTCVQNPEGGFPILAENTRILTIPANPHQVQPSGYTNLEEFLHSYLLEVEGESTSPPFRSNPQPTGILDAGTTQTNISLTTNENATCKYSTIPNTIYDEIINTFTTTGGTTHSTTVTGLEDGQSYNYYVRCADTSSNFNTTDHLISFSISSSSITYNISNFIQLLADWLKTTSLTVDLNNDGIVNTRDLGIMMSGWEG